MASQPARQRTTARAIGETSLAGRYLQLAYDLATGHWQLRSTHAGPPVYLVASAKAELVLPDGSIDIRDVATATLTTCRQEVSDQSPARQRLRVWRSWADGLGVCQSFELDPTSREVTSELSLEPRVSPICVRSLRPLVPIEDGASNLSLFECRHPPSAIDFGWSATQSVRWGQLTDSERFDATGILAVGYADKSDALTLAFVDGREAIGSFGLRYVPEPGASGTPKSPDESTGNAVDRGNAGRVSDRSQPLPLQLEAIAWFGATEVDKRAISSGPLWLGAEPLNLSFPRLAVRLREIDDVALDVSSTETENQSMQTPVPTSAICLGSTPRGQLASTESAVLDQLTGATALHVAVDGALIPNSWEQTPGDWFPDPVRFPHRLEALSDAVRGERWRAGLSLSPLVAARSSTTFQHHPTWFLRTATGDPLPNGSNADEFVLDATQPEVAAWLGDLTRRAAHDWGFNFLRLTELAASVDGGWISNPHTSPVAALRAGVQACREGAGATPLIAAQAPLLGLLHAADVIETCSGPIGRANPAPLLRAFLGATGQLASAGRTVVTDRDQTLDEARAAATIAAMGGGALCLVGPWTGMTTEREDILRVCLPPCRDSVVPLDPFAPDGPLLFGTLLKERWDEWLLVVALNPSSTPRATVASFESLGLKGPHHAFEFWTQRYLGAMAERLTLESIPPGGCAVVALRRVRDEPQIVGTSLHVTMGASDLQDVRLHRDGPGLRVTVTAAGERRGRITIAVPKRWSAATVRGTGGSFHTRPGIEGLVEVELSFRDVAEFQLAFWEKSGSR